jgi:hypothetical protein
VKVDVYIIDEVVCFFNPLAEHRLAASARHAHVVIGTPAEW